ncbi:hypothetical protein Tco_0474751 [Tanacetum coccineum]
MFQLIQHMESLKESILERAKHKREYDKRVNDRTMQSKEGKVDSSKALNASLVVIECSRTESDKQDTSIKSGNDITHAIDADIRPNDQVPFVDVDVNNVLSKPVTPHYLPKVRESVFVKPHHVIASGSSRNSSKESYGSNDMAHNFYLEEAKKKTQDKNMNLKPSVMHTTSYKSYNGSKYKTLEQQSNI